MDDELKEIFKHFDIDKGCYLFKGGEYPINELTIDEYEGLQDAEAKLVEIDGTTMKASKLLEKTREFDNLVLTLAFGKETASMIKKDCAANEYREMIGEVFVFLGKFSGPDGARKYIITLTAKKKSLEKKKESLP